jgi:hypothetical protein
MPVNNLVLRTSTLLEVVLELHASFAPGSGDGGDRGDPDPHRTPISNCFTPLKPDGNYMHKLLLQSVTLCFLFMGFVCFSA